MIKPLTKYCLVNATAHHLQDVARDAGQRPLALSSSLPKAHQAERPLLLTIILSVNLVIHMDILLVTVHSTNQTPMMLRRNVAEHGPRRTTRRHVSLKCPCTPSGAGCFQDSVNLPLPQDLCVSWRHESGTADSHHAPPRDLGVRGTSIVRASTHETTNPHYIHTIEAPRTPGSRGGGQYECCFHDFKKHKILGQGKTDWISKTTRQWGVHGHFMLTRLRFVLLGPKLRSAVRNDCCRYIVERSLYSLVWLASTRTYITFAIPLMARGVDKRQQGL